MPTYWESSKRPLFVKTVVVNGSRHAILSQEDPLSQQNYSNSNGKNSRPDSAGSSESAESSSATSKSFSDDFTKEKIISLGNSKKGGRDLQSCLVKLRMVLAKQENRKQMKGGGILENETGSRKRKKTSNEKKLNLELEDSQNEAMETEEPHEKPPDPAYDSNHNLTIASFFMNETSNGCSCGQTDPNKVERIMGRSDEPESNLQPTAYEIPFSAVSAEGYFTRPFYNRLSERVLQWLDLANKNKPRTEPIQQPQRAKPERRTPRRPLVQQESTEDNSDEVKTEEDIETVLSSELPKFSQELNRLHSLKSAIPEKPDLYAAQLHQSIAESFTSVVSIRSGKYAEKPRPKTVRRHPIRQAKIEESSDEDQSPNLLRLPSTEHLSSFGTPNFFGVVNSRDRITPNIPALHTKVRIPWLREKWPPEEVGKPQLHIFIPALPKEVEDPSDTASVNSDENI